MTVNTTLRALAVVAALGASSAAHAQTATAAARPAPQAGSVTTGSAALKAQAKISDDSARAIARTTVPNGTIQSAEIEREHGKLIYSFDIKVAGKSGIEEVNVDAVTGRLIAHEHETPKAERKEARAEAREQAHPAPAAKKTPA